MSNTSRRISAEIPDGYYISNQDWPAPSELDDAMSVEDTYAVLGSMATDTAVGVNLAKEV